MTSRADVQYVVTEYGVANLLRQVAARAGPGAHRVRPPGLPRGAARPPHARESCCSSREAGSAASSEPGPSTVYRMSNRIARIPAATGLGRDGAVAKRVFVVLIGDGDGKAGRPLPASAGSRTRSPQGRAAGLRGRGGVGDAASTSTGPCASGWPRRPWMRSWPSRRASRRQGSILKNLQGKTGLVLLNAWDASFEPYLAELGRRACPRAPSASRSGDRADPGPAALGRGARRGRTSSW